MTPLRRATWEYVCDYSAQHGFGPTLSEVCAHFGISSLATAKKRIDALIAEGYCARDIGKKQRLRVLMVPREGLMRLDEALLTAGEDGCVRWQNQVVQPGCTFSRAEILRLGWEVVSA